MTREELLAGVEALGQELSPVYDMEESFMCVRAEAKAYEKSLYPLALFLAWLERQESSGLVPFDQQPSLQENLTGVDGGYILAKVRPNKGYESVRIVEAIGKDNLKVCLKLGEGAEMFPVVSYEAVHDLQRTAAREYARNLPGYQIEFFFDETETEKQIEAGMRVESAKPRRTRSEVIRLRTENAIYGGCCERFAEMSGCDCLERAIDDTDTAKGGIYDHYKD